MKKYCLLLLGMLTALLGYSQGAGTPSEKPVKYNIHAPASLVYEVDRNARKYEFEVNIAAMKDTLKLEYEWKDIQPQKGKVAVLPAARKDASGIYFDFFGDMNLEKHSALFLSKKVYDQLKDGYRIEMKIDSAVSHYVYIESVEESSVKYFERLIGDDNSGELFLPGTNYWYNDRRLNNEHLNIIDEKGKLIMVVVDNPDFPLITFIDNGWTMELRTIDVFN